MTDLQRVITDADRDQIAALEASRDRWANDYAELYAENAALRAKLARLECEPVQPLGEYPDIPQSAVPTPSRDGSHPGAGEPAQQDPGAGVPPTVRK